MGRERTVPTLFPELEGQLEDLLVVLRFAEEIDPEDDDSLTDVMEAWRRIGAVGTWGAWYRVMLALRPSEPEDSAHIRAFLIDTPGVSAASLMEQFLLLERVLTAWFVRTERHGGIRFFLSRREWSEAEGREIPGTWV